MNLITSGDANSRNSIIQKTDKSNSESKSKSGPGATVGKFLGKEDQMNVSYYLFCIDIDL